MTRRGFDIQTTPLAGDDELFMRQVGTHKEAKAEMGAAGEGLRIMMSRIIYYCARDAATARATPPTPATSSNGPTSTTSGSSTCASATPRW